MMTNQKALGIVDQIIDENRQLYTKDALEALAIARDALKTIEELRAFVEEAKETGNFIEF